MPSGTPQVLVAIPAAKPWWRSRTLWLNAAVLLLAAVESQLGVLQPLLPVDVYALMAFGLPVANAVVRFITTQALSPPAPQSLPPVPEASEREPRP